MPDDKFRDVIFEVITTTDLVETFDTSHPLSEKFDVRGKTLKKKLRYYEIKHIDNPCQIVLAIKFNKYFENFENKKSNKKYKSMKKGSSGMKFENFALRINSLNNIQKFGKEKSEIQEQYRFTISSSAMEKKITQKLCLI